VAAAVPTGFVRVRELWRDDEFVEHFSDGLSAFLVRQRPAQPGATGGTVEHSVRQGRDSFTGTFGSVHVEVTGFLDTDSLEAVVRGLRAPVR
jgi:hypothetical protein